MRMVHLKVTCQDPIVYHRKVKCTNFLWLFLIAEKISGIVLELTIIWLENLAKNYETSTVLEYISRIINFVNEGLLIFFQWYYIIFFIKKKKLRVNFEKRELSIKTKVLFFWLYFVLAMNTLSYFIYNITEIVLHLG